MCTIQYLLDLTPAVSSRLVLQTHLIGMHHLQLDGEIPSLDHQGLLPLRKFHRKGKGCLKFGPSNFLDAIRKHMITVNIY